VNDCCPSTQSRSSPTETLITNPIQSSNKYSLINLPLRFARQHKRFDKHRHSLPSSIPLLASPRILHVIIDMSFVGARVVGYSHFVTGERVSEDDRCFVVEGFLIRTT